MKKMNMMIAAVTLALTLLGTEEARACGPYGLDAPSEEERATGQVFAALSAHRVRRYVAGVEVVLFDGRRGEARIAYKGARELVVGLLRYRGRWLVTRHVPRRHRA